MIYTIKLIKENLFALAAHDIVAGAHVFTCKPIPLRQALKRPIHYQVDGYRHSYTLADGRFLLICFSSEVYSLGLRGEFIWTDWTGGPMPENLHINDVIEVVHADGSSQQNCAGMFEWDHYDRDADLVRFRLIEFVTEISNG